MAVWRVGRHPDGRWRVLTPFGTQACARTEAQHEAIVMALQFASEEGGGQVFIEDTLGTGNPRSETPGLMEALQTAAQQVAGAQTDSEAERASLIVSTAAETVPGVDFAGVSLLHADHSIISQAVSDESVRDLDQLQATYRQGPCVTALWDEHTVVVDDMATEADRWPQFGPAAVEAGIASMLSFQLFARQGSLGALNLYAARPHTFDSNAQTLGGLFAMQAAAALGETRHVAQLHQAVDSRDVIGQAKGMLMERFGVDAEHAFSMLARSSQETNLKLVAVARWLTGSTERGLQES